MADREQDYGLRELNARAREQWERSSENWEWIIYHPELLDQYRGEYVVIWDKRIVAHGKDPQALRAELEASPYWQEPFLSFRVPTREEVDGILVLSAAAGGAAPAPALPRTAGLQPAVNGLHGPVAAPLG